MDGLNTPIETILTNFDSYCHFNINFDDYYSRIEIIQQAINYTNVLLLDAIKSGTHRHKQHMAHTFRKLLELLEIQFNHDSYFHVELTKIVKNQIAEIKRLFDPLFKILTMDEFSHQEQRLLCKPYSFDFEMGAKFHWKYAELRSNLLRQLIRTIKIKCDWNDIETHIMPELVQKYFKQDEKNDRPTMELSETAQ